MRLLDARQLGGLCLSHGADRRPSSMLQQSQREAKQFYNAKILDLSKKTDDLKGGFHKNRTRLHSAALLTARLTDTACRRCLRDSIQPLSRTNSRIVNSSSKRLLDVRRDNKQQRSPSHSTASSAEENMLQSTAPAIPDFLPTFST